MTTTERLRAYMSADNDAWLGDEAARREASADLSEVQRRLDALKKRGGLFAGISLGEAVFINVTVSLFAGLMPVPGGVGVSEAGMTAGLAAIGVPSDIAVGAVLVYRLISYYLPPLWGYVSLRWLTKHDYL